MGRVRHEEVLRFALLIVLTIALASVAFRIDSHSSGHHALPPSRPHSAGPSTPAPAQVLPTTARRHPHATSPGGSAAPASSPASSPVAASRPILPVTGRNGTLRLAALAFVLIGGGASLRVAASRQRR